LLYSFRIALSMLLLTASTSLVAQTAASSPFGGDVAATFIAERSLKANTTENFWMEGGSAEAGFNVTHGVGFAADYTGTHTSSIGTTGMPLTLSVVVFGPRYRWHQRKRVSVYGEALFGVAFGSDSLFPGPAAATTSAHSFALELNGGLDYKLSRRFALRVLDVGYLRTTLPNATDGQQNTLRLGAGVVWRWGE